MRTVTTIWAGIALAFALAAPALAIDLKSSDITQEGKRVTLHLRFSTAVEYDSVAHYAKNQLILHVTGLKLSKQQLKTGVAVKGGLTEAVDGIALAQPAEQPYGEIRLQLQKGFDPGDAQIIPRDSVIDIEFIVSKPAAGSKGKGSGMPVVDSKPVKPAADEEHSASWTPPAAEEEPLTTLTGQRFDSPLTIGPAVGGSEPVQVTDDPAQEPEDTAGVDPAAPIEPAFQSETAEPAQPETQPLDKPFTADELAQFSGMPGTEPETATDTEDMADSEASASTEPASVELEDAAEPTAIDEEPAATAIASESPDSATSEPAAAIPSGPSYRRLNLNEVAVNQREFRNLPFREAILELVAGSGFNVVVGPGIDNETVYLNFKQKELSLESALETLCAVYELAYSIEDDVITISRQ